MAFMFHMLGVSVKLSRCGVDRINAKQAIVECERSPFDRRRAVQVASGKLAEKNTRAGVEHVQDIESAA